MLPDSDYRDDAMLTTAANNALTLNVTVPPGVEATARDGNLTLTGAVQFGPQRTAAESAVAGWPACATSRTTSTSPTKPTRSTSLLVQDAPDRYALMPDDSDVAVDTHGNTVTLAGQVRTRAEHDAAIGAAWMASGVNDVRDALYVTG